MKNYYYFFHLQIFIVSYKISRKYIHSILYVFISFVLSFITNLETNTISMSFFFVCLSHNQFLFNFPSLLYSLCCFDFHWKMNSREKKTVNYYVYYACLPFILSIMLNTWIFKYTECWGDDEMMANKNENEGKTKCHISYYCYWCDFVFWNHKVFIICLSNIRMIERTYVCCIV